MADITILIILVLKVFAKGISHIQPLNFKDN